MAPADTEVLGEAKAILPHLPHDLELKEALCETPSSILSRWL